MGHRNGQKAGVLVHSIIQGFSDGLSNMGYEIPRCDDHGYDDDHD